MTNDKTHNVHIQPLPMRLETRRLPKTVGIQTHIKWEQSWMRANLANGHCLPLVNQQSLQKQASKLATDGDPPRSHRIHRLVCLIGQETSLHHGTHDTLSALSIVERSTQFSRILRVSCAIERFPWSHRPTFLAALRKSETPPPRETNGALFFSPGLSDGRTAIASITQPSPRQDSHRAIRHTGYPPS